MKVIFHAADVSLETSLGFRSLVFQTITWARGYAIISK